MKKLLSRIMLVLLLAGTAGVAQAQPVTSEPADSVMITRLLQSGNGSTLDFARKFLNVPYVAHTLEVNSHERLVVNTRQLDCTTLVETVVALKLCAEKGMKSFSDYARMLQRLRYRHGKLDGYESRLHYFSDWIDDKKAMGLVEEIQAPNPPFTAVQKLKIDFMSQHPGSYKALKDNPALVKKIAATEKTLTGRTYRYIPKDNVDNTDAMRRAVKDGDIIAITCSKPGLDIAHLGFAVWRKDGLHLLNASQLHKKVVEEPMTLRQYLQKHPSHTGIRIVRLK